MATTHQEELDQLLIYSGKALIKSIVHTEGATAIEVRLTPESVSHPIKVKSADEIIIPFSYRPSASHLVKIFVDSKEYLGILKSVNQHSITFEDYDTGIVKTLRKYDSYEHVEQGRFLSFVPDENSKIYKSSDLRISQRSDYKSDYNISYLSSSISWRPEYHVYLSKNMMNDETITLTIQAVISSNLTKNFHNYPNSMLKDIILVADHTHHNNRLTHQSVQTAMVTRSFDESYNDVEQGNTEGPDDYPEGDYQRYSLPYAIPLVNTTNTVILSVHDVYSQKIYLHRVGSEGTTFGYIFNAPEYLPPGRVYIQDEDDIYLGTTNFKSTVDEGEVEMIIGPTKLVHINSTVMRSSETIETSTNDDLSSNNITNDNLTPDDRITVKTVERTIDIRNTIENKTGDEIDIILRVYTGSSAIVSITPKPPDSDIVIKDEHFDYYLRVNDKISFFDFVVVLSD